MIPTRPPPSFRDPDKWSPEFIDFVSKCLVKNPEQRAIAKELLQVFTSFYLFILSESDFYFALNRRHHRALNTIFFVSARLHRETTSFIGVAGDDTRGERDPGGIVGCYGCSSRQGRDFQMIFNLNFVILYLLLTCP